MAKRKEITFGRSYIKMPRGLVPLDELTPEERKQAEQAMSERALRMMREYYLKHPEEYAKLPDMPKEAE